MKQQLQQQKNKTNQLARSINNSSIFIAAIMCLIIGCRKNETNTDDAKNNSQISDRELLSAEKIFIKNKDSLYALDAGSGDNLWTIPTTLAAAGFAADPTNNRLYIGLQDSCLHMYNANTGAEIWKYKTGGAIYSTPLLADGLIYFGSHDGFLYALNAATGAWKWSVRSTPYLQDCPTWFNNTVYFTGTDGYLYAVHAKTGHIKWIYKTPRPYRLELPQNPAVQNGLIYFNGGDDHLYCLDAANGQFRWKSRLTGLSGQGSVSSPTAENGRVFIRNNADLICMDAFTGSRLWAVQLQYHVTSEPLAKNNMVYIGDNKYIYGIEATTGITRLATPAGSIQCRYSGITAGTLNAGNRIFLSGHNNTFNSTVFALDANTFNVIWKKEFNNSYPDHASPVVTTTTETFYPATSGAQQ